MAGDIYWDNVASLLPMDGSDASTTFTDEKGKTWTANGNAQIDTAQSKFGGASGLFDGTGDYITTPDHADFEFGSGDFTIEGWVRFAALPALATNIAIVQKGRAGSNTLSFAAYITNDLGNYYIRLLASADGTAYSTNDSTAVSLATGQFYHVAWCRSGSTVYYFLDGVGKGTDTVSTNLYNGAAVVSVGANEVGGNPFNGWIDDLRITKGVARYTANFTPPAAAFPNYKGFTGTLNATESGADTCAAGGYVLVQGALAADDSGPDACAISGAGTSFTTGVLAATEAGADTLAVAGTVLIQGSIATTGVALDVVSLNGDVLVQGALAAIESGDTGSISGDVLVQGSLSVSESGADVLAITGNSQLNGAFAIVESGTDTFAGTGDVYVAGAFSASESGADTFAISGDILVRGLLSVSEQMADTAAVVGDVLVRGTFGAIEAIDHQTYFIGAILVRGGLAVTEVGADSFLSPGGTVRETISVSRVYAITADRRTTRILPESQRVYAMEYEHRVVATRHEERIIC